MNPHSSSGSSMDDPLLTADVAQEFHRRIAAIIDAVQTGILHAGLHDLLGHATDYAFGPERGRQTLVLKTRNRSTYIRLQLNTVLGNEPADRQAVNDAIGNAINELV